MAVVKLLLLLYIIAIVLVIIGSWFPMAPGGPAHQAFLFLRRITDPVLEPVRRVIPPVGGVVDLSPTIVLLVLLTLRNLL
jgi:YggT family protein